MQQTVDVLSMLYSHLRAPARHTRSKGYKTVIADVNGIYCKLLTKSYNEVSKVRQACEDKLQYERRKHKMELKIQRKVMAKQRKQLQEARAKLRGRDAATTDKDAGEKASVLRMATLEQKLQEANAKLTRYEAEHEQVRPPDSPVIARVAEKQSSDPEKSDCGSLEALLHATEAQLDQYSKNERQFHHLKVDTERKVRELSRALHQASSILSVERRPSDQSIEGCDHLTLDADIEISASEEKRQPKHRVVWPSTAPTQRKTAPTPIEWSEVIKNPLSPENEMAYFRTLVQSLDSEQRWRLSMAMRERDGKGGETKMVKALASRSKDLLALARTRSRKHKQRSSQATRPPVGKRRLQSATTRRRRSTSLRTRRRPASATAKLSIMW